jgi:hypothetical protein
MDGVVSAVSNSETEVWLLSASPAGATPIPAQQKDQSTSAPKENRHEKQRSTQQRPRRSFP